MGARAWTDEELRIVAVDYGRVPTAQIAVALQRSAYSINRTARSLGLLSPIHRAGRVWSEAEDQLVRDHYVSGGCDRVRGALVAAGFPPRGRSSVYNLALALDLTAGQASDEYRDIQRLRHVGRRSSPATEFMPGHIPWTKGKKGIHLSPITEFKPGSRHGRAAQLYGPIGSVRTRRDKTGRCRRWIKVREDGPESQRWIPLARFLWQRDHGPVPAGHHVVHANGDTLDDSPENLMLMTTRQQTAWQRRIRPQMEIRRATRCSAASRQRWEIYRAIKAKRAELRSTGTGESMPTEDPDEFDDD